MSDFLIKTLQGYMSKFSSQLADLRVEVGCVNRKGGVGVVGCVA